ncbi:LOW QUALITY PROTEIN: hypothetical protein HID58_086647, partial [Brassica napus]
VHPLNESTKAFFNHGTTSSSTYPASLYNLISLAKYRWMMMSLGTFKILLKNMNSTKEVTHRIGALPQELALAVPVTTRMVLNTEIEGRDDESEDWLLDRSIPNCEAFECFPLQSKEISSCTISSSRLSLYESPIVVVLSTSIGPGFKWDALHFACICSDPTLKQSVLSWGYNDLLALELRILFKQEILFFQCRFSLFFFGLLPCDSWSFTNFFCLLKNCTIPIVHYVIMVQERENAEEVDVLTKGASSAEEARNNSKGGMCRCCTLLLFNLLDVWLKDFITSTRRYR